MSGHSKWSKVKHQKATTDVLKAARFTQASRAITVAVKEGGGLTNPDDNFRLRLAIEKARSVNMPKENIERLIAKAKGEGGNAITTVVYEGYAPFGVAIYIEGVTDNIKRTVGFVKQILEHAGGGLASPGAVSYLFERKGVITVPVAQTAFDTLFELGVELGALDVVEMLDVYELFTKPNDIMRMKSAIEEKGIATETAQLMMHPTTTVELEPDKRAIVVDVLERLEALDDVQEVYSNLV
ncbi:MAG: YebC/PmpR family DNA-binding transcriptional regulator [Microgenomates group bacterium]